jgi:hypothetical protein
MITTTLLATALFTLAGQYTEGTMLSGPGCTSMLSGTTTTIALANVVTYKDPVAALPKQGDTFFVAINVLAYPQPCGTHLYVRPGFKLPAGLELVPPGGFNDPVAQCRMGTTGSMPLQPCNLVPTETLPDGTLLFDKPNGVWSIPDGQRLQIMIPVRGEAVGTGTLQGYVDYVAFDYVRPPLTPTVTTQVFFNPPSVEVPDPAVTDVTPYSAHVWGWVDPHYNAGTVRVERAVQGGAFVVVEEAELGADLFTADIDTVMEDLVPDTTYQFRFTYQVVGQSQVTTGPTRTFTTLPRPRHAFSAVVQGQGQILLDPAPAPDGTYPEYAQVIFTVLPDEGQHLERWTLNGATVIGYTETVVVTGPIALAAVFEALPASDNGDDENTNDEGPSSEPEQPNEDEGSAQDGSNDDVSNGVEEDGSDGVAPSTPNELDEEDGMNVTPGVERDNETQADWSGEQSGCAATPLTSAPLAVLAMLLRRRRRA